MQASPPFLVVHTNAAYSRLTGIDSHAVVGKSITCLISLLPSDVPANAEDRQNNAIARGEADAAAGRERRASTLYVGTLLYYTYCVPVFSYLMCLCLLSIGASCLF